ncbi:DNA-binding transcriptional regulator, MarR family [Cupriavidus oxalaticus]|uniref:MarR family winged helix-turn-helix transcriptional regulator n=1 Tax=Cupriavidus oxalaticus TaxID=96344 RepID=UPI003F73140E
MPKSLPPPRTTRAAAGAEKQESRQANVPKSAVQPLPAERPDHDLDHSVGYLLNRAASIIAARFSDDLKPHNINLQAWRVLAALRHDDHQTLSDLASHTGAELSYLSRAVAALEERGYVGRHASASDKRNIHLSLTAQGRAIVAELAPRAWDIERASMSGVSAEELAATLKTLRAIYTNLVDSCQSATGVNRKLTVARRVRRKEAQDEPGA